MEKYKVGKVIYAKPKEKSENYTKFLEDNLNTLPDQGDFILKDGQVIGKHKGIIYYTIGQRKGLNIGGTSDRMYVVGKDIKQNILWQFLKEMKCHLLF